MFMLMRRILLIGLTREVWREEKVRKEVVEREEGFHLRRSLVKDEILQHLRDHGKVKILTQVKIVIKM